MTWKTLLHINYFHIAGFFEFYCKGLQNPWLLYLWNQTKSAWCSASLKAKCSKIKNKNISQSLDSETVMGKDLKVEQTKLSNPDWHVRVILSATADLPYPMDFREQNLIQPTNQLIKKICCRYIISVWGKGLYVGTKHREHKSTVMHFKV